MKSLVVALGSLVIMSGNLLAQDEATLTAKAASEKIEWMSWEEAVSANDAEPRKILVDVYTDWCGWCKVMDRKTFTDEAIVSYINENFHAIKLNAEQKESITWQGYEFKWLEGGRNGVHTLAYSLLDKQMSYPQFVLLDEEFKRIRIIKGFKDAKAFMPQLEYAATEQYKSPKVESKEAPAVKTTDKSDQ